MSSFYRDSPSGREMSMSFADTSLTRKRRWLSFTQLSANVLGIYLAYVYRGMCNIMAVNKLPLTDGEDHGHFTPLSCNRTLTVKRERKHKKLVYDSPESYRNTTEELYVAYPSCNLTNIEMTRKEFVVYSERHCPFQAFFPTKRRDRARDAQFWSVQLSYGRIKNWLL